MRVETSIRTTISEKSGQTELAHVFRAGRRLAFEDGYHHYIHPGALDGIGQLTIKGLQNAEIYFLGPLRGNVEFTEAYAPDSGVINFVDCQNVVVGGLVAENYRQFRVAEKGETGAAKMRLESSNVVNVQNSTIHFKGCHFKSRGKLCFMAHSGSTVELLDSVLDGYYFELFNGASSLTASRCNINQHHRGGPDSHSMLWVSSRHRNESLGRAFDNGSTVIDRCRMDMKSGRSLVSGNGSYDTRSNVTFQNSHLEPGHDKTFGICTWHKNYNSITVETDFGAQREPVDPILDYVSTPNVGFARFVNYYYPLTKDETRPGGPREQAPIVVDGVSSVDV